MEDVTDTQELRTDPAASELVAACETVWSSIREHHPELPTAVMLLGTGIERGRLVKLGHWWGGRWLADGDIRGEVLLAGEALHLDPIDVFEVLLHEAAHGINAARGIKDTSRGGRYHNARFKGTAIEVGLDVAVQEPYGFAATSVPDATAEKYTSEIDRLGSAMRIARRIPPNALQSTTVTTGAGQVSPEASGRSEEDDKRPKVPPAECGCGRRLRMAPTVLAQGPVICGNCGTEFEVGRQARRPRAVEPTAVPQEPELDDIAHVQAPADPVDSPRKIHDDPAVAAAEAVIVDATRGDDGYDVVVTIGQWRRHLNTELEAPMEVMSEYRQRWEELARAVLTIDGLLHGPEIELRDGFPVRAGDHVVIQPRGQSTSLELPEVGTPGVVTDVRLPDRRVMVDFATAGVYAIDVAGVDAAALGYDYCAHSESPVVEVDTPRAGVGSGVEL